MKFLKQIALIFGLIILFSAHVFAQKEKQPKLIQFSGVVLNADSLQPIPFTSVMIKNSHSGTISDYYGYFSFVAQVNDTIVFSYLGFKDSYFVIPDTLSENRYSIIQMMKKDTVYLKAVKVHPWPTREQFKEAFLHAPIPYDDLARAKNNLSSKAMATKAFYYSHIPDPNINYKRSLNNYSTMLYNAGQVQTISLLNPLAWAQFIKDWREGKLKRQ